MKQKHNYTLVFIFVLSIVSACQNIEPSETVEVDQSISLIVRYTSDEHGWMLGEQDGEGAANILSHWRLPETNDETHQIILSGGDNWTGPAISTWFEGESMVDVMNHMGYSSSAIGNHEFDFGLQVLSERIQQANFPYLSANIRNKTDGKIPTELGIRPYEILDYGSIQLGIIGLTTVDTPSVTNPNIVEGFKFVNYEEALREYVPEVRQKGADIIMVVSHICPDDLLPLVANTIDLNISLFGGGHCHQVYAGIVSGVVILSGGSNFSHYATAVLEMDISSGELDVIEVEESRNSRLGGDNDLEEVISNWQSKVDKELEVPLGYLAKSILQRSNSMAALVTESWLWYYPTADIALTNWGGFRDNLPAGTITTASIISVLPFNNVLIDVSMSGEELNHLLKFGPNSAKGGLHWEAGVWYLDNTGLPIDDQTQTTYSVLVNDFMYAGGDDNTMLQEFDPDAYNTSINWRQPVIEWIIAQISDESNPLDTYVSELLE